MTNYKLIEAHTMQGESAHMWFLLDGTGHLPKLRDGTMIGMFPTPPPGLEPEDIAQVLVRYVQDGE